jgi:hypothetical protein
MSMKITVKAQAEALLDLAAGGVNSRQIDMSLGTRTASISRIMAQACWISSPLDSSTRSRHGRSSRQPGLVPR